MKYVLIYRLALLEMLDHDSLEQLRGHPRIPDALRIHDDDRPVAADAEARCLAALHSLRSEEEILALQELREQRIDLPSAAARRAEVAGAYEYVARIRFHRRGPSLTHSAKI